VITCKSAAEARAAIVAAQRILEQLIVQLHPQKTRIVHVRQGFEFLGFKIKRGQRPLRLMPHQIQSGVRNGDLYAYPKRKSIRHFMDQVRERTKRRVPLTTTELIAPAREGQVLDRVVELGGAGPLPPDRLRRIYQTVIQEMRTWEEGLSEHGEDKPPK
jgi:chorismate mutase